MEQECSECGALNFAGERTLNDKQKFTLCCQKGKVMLQPLLTTPPLMSNWIKENPNDLERAIDFKNNIVNYNANLAFASREANYDRIPGRGPYCMRIHGMIYHHFSSLRPRVSGNEKYAQLYILDNAEAINQRMGNNLNSYKQYFKFLINNACRL